jgi:hypothetical protein
MLKGWVKPEVNVCDLPPLTEPSHKGMAVKKLLPVGETIAPASTQPKKEDLVDLFEPAVRLYIINQNIPIPL